MGKINVKLDGKTYELDDQMNSEEAKKALGLPSNDVLINSQGKVLRGRLNGQVSDGENIAKYPDFQHWM